MGRPLTDKWTGFRADSPNPVLWPTCNIGGNITYCSILRQVGSNKFLVSLNTDPTVTCVITLTNGSTANSGDGWIQWTNNFINGYVSKITDNTVHFFDGGSAPWTIYYPPSGNNVYVSSNSDD